MRVCCIEIGDGVACENEKTSIKVHLAGSGRPSVWLGEVTTSLPGLANG